MGGGWPCRWNTSPCLTVSGLPVPSLLVTGGAGFIGGNFTHHWLSRHPEDVVVVLDALTYAGNLAGLGLPLTHPRLKFVQDDIRSSELTETLLRWREVMDGRYREWMRRHYGWRQCVFLTQRRRSRDNGTCVPGPLVLLMSALGLRLTLF
jgi:GDP-mannose 4,6 dehydratase